MTKWFEITTMDMDDGPAWELNIAIRAKDAQHLKQTLSNIYERLIEADTPKKLLRQSFSGVGSGEDNFTARYAVAIRCPDEVEVTELRRRADKLEAQLNRNK